MSNEEVRGYEDKELIQATQTEILKRHRLNAIRSEIDKSFDAPSREGIIADVLAVVVVGLSQLTAAMAKAKTIEDIKAAAAPLAEIGAVIDAGVKSGDIKLPFTIKEGGAKGVLEKMVGLSNGVTAVLQASRAQS